MKIKICYTWIFDINKNNYPENFTEKDILKQEVENAKEDPYILVELSDNDPLEVTGEILK